VFLREITAAVWHNKRALPYAWQILRHGVCDGCSLGGHGLRDSVTDGIHLCATRLQLLGLNTMPALEASAIADADLLRRLSEAKLRSLGRLPFPMVRRRSEKGFSRVSWDDALESVAQVIRKIAPQRMGFLATGTGITNEVYYVFQKLARTLGTNNVDLGSPLGHAASIDGLRATLGMPAATCSLSDLVSTDLLIVFGSDLGSHHLLATQYMDHAKKRGTFIAVVSPMREYRLERYWSSSDPATALLGKKLMDDFYQVRPGGEIAFINGMLKALIETNRVDHRFVVHHTHGFDELRSALEQQSWRTLEQIAGLPRLEMERLAQIYGSARTAVLVHCLGPTQHGSGAEDVKAIVNLILARGLLGRERCGILPMGSESGIQGGRESGFAPDTFPGGFEINEQNTRRFSNLWRHPVSSIPGLKATQMIEEAHNGNMGLFYLIGSNPLETPEERWVSEALTRVPVRVHQDLALNSSMLVDPGEIVIVLPGQTRYEQRSGGTTTSIDRRIRFTPEIPGRQIGQALAEWEIPCLVARKAMLNGEQLFGFRDTLAIRAEMSRIIPIYHGLEKLKKEGDSLQWGGSSLFRDGKFSNMPGGRALFSVLVPPDLGS
jgi:molybdopterin-dependent oxidoreductase alpha subunit